MKHQRPRTVCDRVQKRSGVSRRRFLRDTTVGTAGLVAAPHILVPESRARVRNSKVIRAYHPEATDGNSLNQEAIDVMVARSIRELTGTYDLGDAWKSLFPGITPDKRISIKINLACGDIPTHPEVVNAVIDGLLLMDLDGEQLPPENIIVWDADYEFLCPQTGYPQNWGGPGVQYTGTTHPSIGYDMTQTFTIRHPGSTSDHHVTRLITEFTDYLINIPVIKDHSQCDVTFTMKNHYGSFDNIPINPMHFEGADLGIPSLSVFLRDNLGDKTCLLLMDATIGLMNGGPGYIPPYHTAPNWWYDSVLMSFDTVAIDKICLVKMNEARAAHHPPYPAIDAGHIPAAAGPPHDLGTDDLGEIDLVEVDASDTSAVEGPSISAAPTALLSPYPSPARGACTLRFRCRSESRAEIILTDVSGAVVRRIADARFAPGLHRFQWNGCDDRGRHVPTGTYFVRLQADGRTQHRQVVLLR